MADPTPRPLPPSALARVIARLWQRRLEREAKMREADAEFLRRTT